MKDASSGRVQDVPFVYQFNDPKSSMEAASLKILYSVHCQQQRKRRSLIEDNDDGFEDEPLAFTSWDRRYNSTVAEKSCMTFKTTVGYVDSLVQDLSRLLNQGETVTKLSETVSSDIRKIQNQMNGTTSDVQTSQIKMLSSITLEISGFQERSNASSLYSTWREKGEIFTAENNFTVCFGMEDCISTALESLENLPLVSPEHMSKYKNSLVNLKEILTNRLLNFDSNQVTFERLSEATGSVLYLLKDLNKTSLHCSKIPVMEPIRQKEFNVRAGEAVELECGEVDSALPVTFNWKHHGNFIDRAFKDSLSVTASVEKAGIYTCVVTSSVGQVSSEGILVNVYEVPKIVSQPEDQTVITPNQFNNASFVCEVAGYPIPDISWYYKSFSGDTSEITLASNQPEITLENITSEDRGFYFCRANNSYGPARSRSAKLDVVASELPKQFIEISVLIQNKEYMTDVNGTNVNSTRHIYEELIEKLRVSPFQNITYSVVAETQSSERLYLKVESILSARNETELASMKELLRVATKSRQNLANSAANLVNLVFSNQSKIFLSGDVVLTVDNTSVTYKATLDQCKPGYQLHKNGIICGKLFSL